MNQLQKDYLLTYIQNILYLKSIIVAINGTNVANGK